MVGHPAAGPSLQENTQHKACLSMTAGPRARIPEPRRARRMSYLTPSILKDLGTKPQGSEVTCSLSLTHLGSCWDTEPTFSFLGRGPDRPQAANWAWAAFPSQGTTKNSMQATQIPGSCQPHLSPDLVAWAASLPTPCSHLELSSLSLQSFQTQQGLSSSTLARQEGLQPSRAPPGAESWPGRQTQLAFGYPQGRVCSTLAVLPAQPPLSESPLYLGLPHPPGLIVALSMEPLLPWSVTYSFAVPSSLPFYIIKYSSAVSPFNLHLQVPIALCVLCITDLVLCFTLHTPFLTVSCHCDLVSVTYTSDSELDSEV